MRRTLLLPLALAACTATRPSTFFHDLRADARDYVERSGGEKAWASRFPERRPPGRTPQRLPGAEILSFVTREPLSEDEERELFDRLEVEIVRGLFRGGVRLRSRRETPPSDGLREFAWEYEAGDRRGLVTAWGLRREPGYEITITVHEMRWTR